MWAIYFIFLARYLYGLTSISKIAPGTWSLGVYIYISVYMYIYTYIFWPWVYLHSSWDFCSVTLLHFQQLTHVYLLFVYAAVSRFLLSPSKSAFSNQWSLSSIMGQILLILFKGVGPLKINGTAGVGGIALGPRISSGACYSHTGCCHNLMLNCRC